MAEEIEIKLKYKDREAVTNLLKQLGAKLREKYELHDTYFGFQKDMSHKHTLIRIREKNKACELTLKGKCETKEHIWKRVELTTSIGNPEDMSEMLTHLGVSKIKENASLREIYDLDDLEIAFIDFTKPAKLSLLELEGSEEKINEVLNKLGNSVEKVGEEVFSEFDKLAQAQT